MALHAPTPHPDEKAGRKVSLATLATTAVERSALPEAQEPRHAFRQSSVPPFVGAVLAH